MSILKPHLATLRHQMKGWSLEERMEFCAQNDLADDPDVAEIVYDRPVRQQSEFSLEQSRSKTIELLNGRGWTDAAEALSTSLETSTLVALVWVERVLYAAYAGLFGWMQDHVGEQLCRVRLKLFSCQFLVLRRLANAMKTAEESQKSALQERADPICGWIHGLAEDEGFSKALIRLLANDQERQFIFGLPGMEERPAILTVSYFETVAAYFAGTFYLENFSPSEDLTQHAVRRRLCLKRVSQEGKTERNRGKEHGRHKRQQDRALACQKMRGKAGQQPSKHGSKKK